MLGSNKKNEMTGQKTPQDEAVKYGHTRPPQQGPFKKSLSATISFEASLEPDGAIQLALGRTVPCDFPQNTLIWGWLVAAGGACQRSVSSPWGRDEESFWLRVAPAPAVSTRKYGFVCNLGDGCE